MNKIVKITAIMAIVVLGNIHSSEQPLCTVTPSHTNNNNHSLNKEEKSVNYSIILPGANENKGIYSSDNGITNAQATEPYTSLNPKTYVPTGEIETFDLGQTNCIKHFAQQWESNTNKWGLNNVGKNIMYGISHDTATLINALAKTKHEMQEILTKGIVLESVLGSGDNFIWQDAVSTCPQITYLPFARLWLPRLLGSCIYQAYKSNGPQLLSSIKKISPNVPVIIMHNVNDSVHPINDARQAYINARNANHNNVYLMEINTSKSVHYDLLGGQNSNKKLEDIAALQAIYKKEGLPYIRYTPEINHRSSTPTHMSNALDNLQAIKISQVDLHEQIEQIKLQDYQPSIKDVQARINTSTRFGRWTRNAIDAATVGGIAGLIYYKYFRS